MTNSDPNPNTPSLPIIIRSYLEALRNQLVELCKTDYRAFGMFNFHEFHERYLEEHETLNDYEKERLFQAQQLVKNILFKHILRRVKGEAENVENYCLQHRELSEYEAARNYFLLNTGARAHNHPNDYIVLTVIFAPLGGEITKEFSYNRVAQLADKLTTNDIAQEMKLVNPYAMFDKAFQLTYGRLNKTKPARSEGTPAPAVAPARAEDAEAAQNPAAAADSPESKKSGSERGAELQPHLHELKQHGSDPVEAIVNAAKMAPTGSAQFRNVGTYAFTWWVIKRDDLDKVQNQHYYPRHRGDFHPSHEELPNKEIARFLLGNDENFGKVRGRVSGRYLGWMGLTKKGFLEGKEHGQLVPRFEVAEDEVVVLGAAHISRVDLLRLKFRGLNPWKMDWDTFVWKWDVWEGGSGGEGPGKVEVRVLFWDEKGGGARFLIEQMSGESPAYEDVVRNPARYIAPFFDNLFNSENAGLKGVTVEIVGTEGSNLGNHKTDNEGRVTIRGLFPGQEVELLASKKNYQGVEGAPKAPLLHPIEREEGINRETNVARRYLTTPRQKEGPKRALLILKKKTGKQAGETNIPENPPEAEGGNNEQGEGGSSGTRQKERRLLDEEEEAKKRVEEAFDDSQSLFWMSEKGFDALVRYLKVIKKLAGPRTRLQRVITALQRNGQIPENLPPTNLPSEKRPPRIKERLLGEIKNIGKTMEPLLQSILEKSGRPLQLLALLPYYMVFSYEDPREQKSVIERLSFVQELLPQELPPMFFDDTHVHSILEEMTEQDLKNSLKLFSALCRVVAARAAKGAVVKANKRLFESIRGGR